MHNIVMLISEQVSEYHEKGYVALRGIFNADEVAAWDAESKHLLELGIAHEHNLRTVTYRTSTGALIVDRYSPIIDLSLVFKALTEDERILNCLRQLCSDDMLLFKDKIIYKMPGVPGYNIHQDYSYWQTFPKELVNVIVSIDRADEDNGGVEFFPGYHDRLLSTAGELRAMNKEEARQIDFSKGEIVKTKPGDVVIFDGLTPHRSSVNHTHSLRRQVYLTYSPAKHGDLYREQIRHFAEAYRHRVGWEAKERLFFR